MILTNKQSLTHFMGCYQYDHIYLYSYEGGKELYQGLTTFFDQYNYENPHAALGMKSPAALWK